MAGILTTASTITCGHGGTVSAASTAKLTVNGNAVLHKADIAGKMVSTCTTPSSSSSKPCATVTSVTAGEAAKLTCGGLPVMLDTLAGTTDGNPVGNVPASAGQTKLTAT